MTKKERIAILEAKVVQLEIDVRNLQQMIVHPVLMPYTETTITYEDKIDVNDPNFWRPKITC